MTDNKKSLSRYEEGAEGQDSRQPAFRLELILHKHWNAVRIAARGCSGRKYLFALFSASMSQLYITSAPGDSGICRLQVLHIFPAVREYHGAEENAETEYRQHAE